MSGVEMEDTGDGARYCMRHPTVATRVSCATCNRPLCPKCMIYTPVGIKCKDCAQMRRPVQYTITPGLYARVIPGAVLVSLAIGWLLSYVPYLGFIGGLIVGVAISAALKRISGYKQGREMEIIACASVALAVVSSSVFYVARALGGHWSTAIHDALSAQMLGPNALGILVGCYIAVQQLR